MATAPTKAAQRATYKGKYKGPDEFRGDEKTRQAWIKAGRPKDHAGWLKKYKKGSSSPASAAAPAAAPEDPSAPQSAYQGVDTGTPVNSNSSGSIDLQTSFDIEQANIENENNRMLAESNAATATAQANENKRLVEERLLKEGNQAYGQANTNAAYRGMRGDTAVDKRAEVSRNILNQKNANDTAYNNDITKINAAKEEGAGQGYIKRKMGIDAARLAYTQAQSRTNPTPGSSPEDAGVAATNPGAELPTAAGTTSAAAAKPTYKGKYAGPDLFKGDAKKRASYKAALKPGMSAAAKRKLQQKINSGR